MLKKTLLLVPLLASCVTGGPATNPVQLPAPPAETKIVTQTKIVDTSCDWAKPIYVSKLDVLTDATAAAILAHNRTGAQVCGWKPSTK